MPITVNTVIPAISNVGDIWFDPNSCQLYVWQGSGWLNAGNHTAGMGLGPPVCEKCMVLGELTIISDGSGYDRHVWGCPICLGTSLKESLWTCGWTEKELEDNLRFRRFVKGESPDR